VFLILGKDDRVEDIRFDGRGCAISMASASLMTELLKGKTEAEAKRLFAALADGGQVRMPLTKTFFSPSFGMLADRFGVGWMVIVDND